MRGSPYTDLDRPPLRQTELTRALVVPDGLWTRLELHRETASTNTDAAGQAAAGAPEGLIVVAERQTAGRGRLGRAWASPARAGLAVSVLLRPGEPGKHGWAPVPATRYGWLPLLAGVALAEAVDRVAGVEVDLKWPNDLLVADRKCGGILAETVPAGAAQSPAVVVGIGLNVSLREDELPHSGATSLLLAGAQSADRDPLIRALLRTLASWYARWREANGDPEISGLRDSYLYWCATVDREVRVALPDNTTLRGTATTVDSDGRLVVEGREGMRAVAAGDVVHVRALS